jgi:hypothetical protein
MAIEIDGKIAYDIRKGYPKPLTDSQADILIAEYAKIGLRFKKGNRKGEICIYARARIDDYKYFCAQHAIHHEEIYNRAGGIVRSLNNSYEWGKTHFSPPDDWNQIVKYIEKNVKPWWKFWARRKNTLK